MKNRKKSFRKSFRRQFEMLTHSQKCACGWRAFDLFYSMPIKSCGLR
mgnify:CR=1 FL=1